MKHASSAGAEGDDTRPRPAGEGEDGGSVVCTACPLLCDDIVPTPAGPRRACEFGVAALVAAAAARAVTTEAWHGGVPVSLETALDRAARLLATARRVLVTGLAAATLEATRRACDLAETLGAAIDPGEAESGLAAGPTIARVGEVTAAWEELRDRAELVVFWFHDPARRHPRFIERFVQPGGARPDRRTVSIGPAAVLPPGPAHLHVPLAAEDAVEAARLLHAQLAGPPAGRRPEDEPTRWSAVAAATAELARAIDAAGCIGIVTGEPAGTGLGPWSIAHVTRWLAHGRPAFCIPLSAGIDAGGGNSAGVAAICTWRYGAAGAIARADRAGGHFLPGEASADRLIGRGEVDCVLAVGPLAATVREALRGRPHPPTLVQVGDSAVATPSPAVHIRCIDPSRGGGTMLREDGRRIVLPPRTEPASLRPLEQILAELADRVARSSTQRPAGATS